MTKKEKVLKGLEQHITWNEITISDEDIDSCRECPYLETGDCTEQLVRDALELLKEQDKIIAEYHEADIFLAVHGWRWTNDT